MDRFGRYKIVRELGRGAMGVVYLATDPTIGRPVAIKTIRLGEVGNTGSPLDGWVLDPFSRAGTTALVSKQLGRNAVGIELNPEYVALSEARIEIEAP